MTTATTSNEICTDCGFPFDCPDGHGECNGQFIEKAQPPEAATPRYRFGDNMPWTEGDAKIALEYGEELGSTHILEEIVTETEEGLTGVAYVEYYPLGSDEDNAPAQRVLDILNAHDGLVAALAGLLRVIDRDNVGFRGSPALPQAREALKLARGE